MKGYVPSRSSPQGWCWLRIWPRKQCDHQTINHGGVGTSKFSSSASQLSWALACLSLKVFIFLVLVVGGWVHSCLEMVWGKIAQKSPLCSERSSYSISSTQPNILRLCLGTISCYYWQLLPDSFSLLPSCCLQMDQKAVQIIRTSSAKLLFLAKSRLLSFSIVKTFAWSLKCLTLTPACSN